MSDTPRRYLSVLDLLRLLSMLAIVTFHSTEFVFYTDTIPIQSQTYLYRVLHEYARLIPYSGHYIILLSFFLIGYTRKIYKNLARWVMLFFSAHVMVLLAFHEGPIKTFKFEWDIYPFLALSLLLLSVLQKFDFKYWKTLLACSLLVLVLPFDVLSVSKDFPVLKMLLTGHCDGQNLGAWPIYPWLALPLFSISLGTLSHKHFSRLQKMSFKEFLFWCLGLGLCLAGYVKFHLPIRESFPIGGGFYCFILRRPPLEFWSSFFPFIFLMRMAFVLKTNLKLSHLSWNNNFALTYIIHLGLLSLGIFAEEIFLKFPVLFDVFILIVILGSEFLGRLTVRFANGRKIKT